MDRTAKIVVVLVILAVSGFFIFSKMAGWHKNELDNAVKQVQETSKSKTDKLEQEIIGLEQELADAKGQIIPEEKLAEVFGGDEKSTEKEKLAVVMGEVKRLANLVRNEKELAAVLRDEKKNSRGSGKRYKINWSNAPRGKAGRGTAR